MADNYLEFLKESVRNQADLKVPEDEQHPHDAGPHMMSGRKEGMCPNPACKMYGKTIKIPEGQSLEDTSCQECSFTLSGTKHKGDPWSD